MGHRHDPAPHTFHVPVMGTGFTIDSPVRVARFGISTTISLVDDCLIEKMREYHCALAGLPYQEIADDEEDARARRITAYLDLLDQIVEGQMRTLRTAPFAPGSEITRYFELLPPGDLRGAYERMLGTEDPAEQRKLQDDLRARITPGAIDANIMAKGDRDAYRDGQKLPAEFSDAAAAARGFANSRVGSTLVFSAGFNPRLYRYVGTLDAFAPNADGTFHKRVALKVSDFHSALVQGRFLAKCGVWVSQFRIESGLNCGGHAFATKGLLLGPILETFRQRWDELRETLWAAYCKSVAGSGRAVPTDEMDLSLSVQGGIGTHEEDALLREHFEVDSTGWATPFLLVPEVTHVDEEHLDLLCQANENDVYLSDSSPFGLPFWNLRQSASERARIRRIDSGRPGANCGKGYIKLYNMEFTDRPICTASQQYQTLKLRHLAEQDLTEKERLAHVLDVLAKSCICQDLAGGAVLNTQKGMPADSAVCPGPGIVHFTRVATLEEMVAHIYGRDRLFDTSQRPHFFLREIEIYIDYLEHEITRARSGLVSYKEDYLAEFHANLLLGVAFYDQFAENLDEPSRDGFQHHLAALKDRLLTMSTSKQTPVATASSSVADGQPRTTDSPAV